MPYPADISRYMSERFRPLVEKNQTRRVHFFRGVWLPPSLLTCTALDLLLSDVDAICFLMSLNLLPTDGFLSVFSFSFSFSFSNFHLIHRRTYIHQVHKGQEYSLKKKKNVLQSLELIRRSTCQQSRQKEEQTFYNPQRKAIKLVVKQMVVF